jgi:uncharacterized protein (TIGR03435 family)
MSKIACGLLGAFLAAGLYAQGPQFEVASMKALPPGEPGRQRTVDGAQLRYPGVNLLFLLREAYRLKSREQVDGPAWMRTQMYDIQAKLPANASQDQIPEMLQALLAERLKLSIHHEMRPLPNNVLLVGKKGLKMRRATEQDEDLDLKLDVPLVHLSGRGSMQQLIDQFNHGLGGPDPWVDMTGLSGLFEFKLEFDMSPDSRLAQGEEILSAPRLPQALEQQLGLRVEVRKAPTDIVLVDRVERFPTAN